MAIIAFDSGEATQYPDYANVNTGGAWQTVANKPSAWQIISNTALASLGISTSGAFSGTTCIRLNASANTCAMRRNVNATTHAENYISFMVKLDGTLRSQDFFSLRTSAGDICCRLNSNASGDVLVYAGTTPTLKATIAAGLAPSTWYNIQLHFKAGVGALAVLEVSIAGATPVDCSGTTMADWYWLECGQVTSATGCTMYFDCIAVYDTTGTENNSWPGAPKILTAQRPTSDDPDVSDWTRNTGSNDFDMIKENQPDLDATYVYSNLTGDESLYGFSGISEPENTIIKAVCLTAIAKRADAAFLTPLVFRTGHAMVELTSLKKAVGSDYMTPIEWILELDPITNEAWHQEDLNATEFGFKHTTS